METATSSRLCLDSNGLISASACARNEAVIAVDQASRGDGGGQSGSEDSGDQDLSEHCWERECAE